MTEPSRETARLVEWIEEHCLDSRGEPVRLVGYQQALLESMFTGSLVAIVDPKTSGRAALLGWVAAAQQAGILEQAFGPRPGQAAAVLEASRRRRP